MHWPGVHRSLPAAAAVQATCILRHGLKFPSQRLQGRDAAPLAEWTELENGCICCSAKNDMVKALESLMQQRSRFDYVLIETTGVPETR